jgi:Asp/Glu/hydantoin racemase
MYKYMIEYPDKKEERLKMPGLRKIIDDIMTQCVAAIEKDRADSILLSCEPILTFESELRKKLDEAGYNEIPLISGVAAGIEMARAMVNMKLRQTARAYPGQDLKAKPEYW